MITTIGDHYRGSNLPPCLHADAFHSPVSKPLHQKSQIKNEAPPKKPSEQSWKVFSFQCGPKEAMKKLWLQSIGLLYSGWLFPILKKKVKSIISHLDRDAPFKHEVSELQANVCSELRCTHYYQIKSRWISGFCQFIYFWPLKLVFSVWK